MIVPTYINEKEGKESLIAKAIGSIGADLKRQFDPESYKRSFADSGYENVRFFVVGGRMPCAVAVLEAR